MHALRECQLLSPAPLLCGAGCPSPAPTGLLGPCLEAADSGSPRGRAVGSPGTPRARPGFFSSPGTRSPFRTMEPAPIRLGWDRIASDLDLNHRGPRGDAHTQGAIVTSLNRERCGSKRILQKARPRYNSSTWECHLIWKKALRRG